MTAVGEARLSIVDFGGHPFTATLAGQLHDEGYDVTYSYCSSNEMCPTGNMDSLRERGLEVNGIDLGHSFAKHNPIKRFKDEVIYGWRLARSVRSETIVACQLPLISGSILRTAARLRGQRYVNWLQDFQSDLAALTSGKTVARILTWFEAQQIRSADHVVCISEGFAERVKDIGGQESVAVLPNWAPVEDLDVQPRINEWSTSNGLDERSFRVSYSGTLGSKHRSHELGIAIKELLTDERFEFVFTAAGVGYNELKSDPVLAASDRVHFWGLQDYDDLPKVLGAADVLVATLDPTATEACVPSKILSYLCAGRPIVAFMDSACPSAQIVEEAEAGVATTTAGDLVNAITKFVNEPEDRKLAGKQGRSYAERNFSRDAVIERFVKTSTIERF